MEIREERESARWRQVSENIRKHVADFTDTLVVLQAAGFYLFAILLAMSVGVGATLQLLRGVFPDWLTLPLSLLPGGIVCGTVYFAWPAVALKLDQLLPDSHPVQSAMRWWMWLAVVVVALVFSFGESPRDGELLFAKWLWTWVSLVFPLALVWDVIEHRPPPTNEETLRIATKMALADQVSIEGKKFWMIAGRPLDPDNEEGRKWLVVAVTAHLGDATVEYNRRWARPATMTFREAARRWHEQRTYRA